MSGPATASRVRVRGRVQGVGFRAWAERQARARGLSGWVRNRRDGSVEAQFQGPAAAVEAMTAACREGPAFAQVDAIRIETTEPSDDQTFRVLETE